uniref:PEP-CTERM sorting domain-containing protein n=1 Tax=Schlesneria paludicola TaxID=360056 RepID=A0A7C2NTM6_9PLAN
MLRTSCLAAAVLLAVGTTNAFATVGGQTYIIDVQASASGDIKARMEFVDGPGPGDAGDVGIDIEDAGDYTGIYSTAPGSTVVTNYSVTAVAPDDGFFTSFSGTAVDLKQSMGLIGTIANALDLPGITLGFGFSTSGDLFFFTGEELLD